MHQKDLTTSAKNTWCPGCGNFAILNSLKALLNTLNEDNFPLKKVVIVSGIGCHAKIVDYININSFYSLHGRAIPTAEGIKLANSDLKVIGFVGDGDAYGEGLEHLIFAAKRNIDLTMIIHNNCVYGLTTGQYTPTSPLGFRGRSTPKGTKELPLNPLELMLASGATFIARGYSHGMDLLKRIFKEAVMHKGFSVIDILQVCVTFYNMYEQYSKKVYELKDHDSENYDEASNRIREWDYNSDAPIALGTFYQKVMPTFGENFFRQETKIKEQEAKIKQVLEEAI